MELMMNTCDFQPRQIVSLEHEGTYLYAEVIQVVEARQMCWVRPLMLVFLDPPYPFEPRLYDLRSSADLLWPREPFRSALDTEVMPLLVRLLSLEPQSNHELTAAQQLSQFIHQVWQARSTAF